MLKECIKMAFEGMLSNKLRTFLTMLGIIIGVGAVIAMVSFGPWDAGKKSRKTSPVWEVTCSLS